MTKTEIENTKWATEFKLNAPEWYDKAIEIALTPNLHVDISFSNESGLDFFVITPNNQELSAWDNGFWLNGKETIAEAVAVCQEMGWVVDTVIMEKK